MDNYQIGFIFTFFFLVVTVMSSYYHWKKKSIKPDSFSIIGSLVSIVSLVVAIMVFQWDGHIKAKETRQHNSAVMNRLALEMGLNLRAANQVTNTIPRLKKTGGFSSSHFSVDAQEVALRNKFFSPPSVYLELAKTIDGYRQSNLYLRQLRDIVLYSTLPNPDRNSFRMVIVEALSKAASSLAERIKMQQAILYCHGRRNGIDMYIYRTRQSVKLTPLSDAPLNQIKKCCSNLLQARGFGGTLTSPCKKAISSD